MKNNKEIKSKQKELKSFVDNECTFLDNLPAINYDEFKVLKNTCDEMFRMKLITKPEYLAFKALIRAKIPFSISTRVEAPEILIRKKKKNPAIVNLTYSVNIERDVTNLFN